MDPDDLLACLDYYRRVHNQSSVWGGRIRKPDSPPPPDDPEIRWWCDYVARDGADQLWRGGPPIGYDRNGGWDIWESYRTLEAAKRIRTIKGVRNRNYYQLVDPVGHEETGPLLSSSPEPPPCFRYRGVWARGPLIREWCPSRRSTRASRPPTTVRGLWRQSPSSC